jgi:hypothetical protein
MIEGSNYHSKYNYTDNSRSNYGYNQRESDVSESSVSDDDVLTKPF